MLHIDFTFIEVETDPKVKDVKTLQVLVVIDHFTRFAQAFVLPDKTAQTMAKCLHERVFPTFRAPAKLCSDQGREFKNEVIARVCKEYGIKKIRTTPYHPQTNAQPKHFHQTMIHMIGKLDREEKADWPRYLPALIQVYNATRSAVTGYSPHYLLMGRRPRIPIDVTFPTLREKYHTTVKVHSYVHSLKRALKRAYSIAQSCTKAEAARQKRYYDRRANAPILEPGDLVLLKISGYKGKRKVLDHWDNQPWKVVMQLDDDVPADMVMDPWGVTRVLHRNNLFRWFKFTLKPPYTVAIGNFFWAIWDTSH